MFKKVIIIPGKEPVVTEFKTLNDLNKSIESLRRTAKAFSSCGYYILTEVPAISDDCKLKIIKAFITNHTVIMFVEQIVTLEYFANNNLSYSKCLSNEKLSIETIRGKSLKVLVQPYNKSISLMHIVVKHFFVIAQDEETGLIYEVFYK